MADFIKAYQKVLLNEGIFSDDPTDNGGRTVLGISEKNWPNWEGWKIVNTLTSAKEIATNAKLQNLVQSFYLQNFWNKINGDIIASQKIAESIFDFSVNAGIKTSSSLAQTVVGSEPDGIIGKNTVAKLNIFNPTLFVAQFALLKIDRYCDIVDKKPDQLKYLKGWVRRTLKSAL